MIDAVIHHKADEYPDCQKRKHFNQGFKGNGGNHAFVMFIGINETCAKQNAKKGQANRGPKPTIGKDADGFAHRGNHAIFPAGQNRIAGGNRFQLKRDIGRCANHRDQGDKHRKLRAFAIAR